jgi:N-succinyldiaminopimelate aminotransferase
LNPDLNLLQPYPFEKLNALKAQVNPPEHMAHIALSIGEPKHPAPELTLETLNQANAKLSIYPKTKGLPELNSAIGSWLCRRFKLNAIDPDTQVLPVNGTREALFSFTQAVVNRQTSNPLVLCPNPFYQIYEGAAYLAGASPYFLNCLPENGYIPDYDQVPESVWRDCQLLFICSPGNPTGAVTDISTLKKLIGLADQYDFIIASDECYSELYFDEERPPAGLLQACDELNRADFSRCIVFHSLSKRSNLPGLRSGFVAGDASILKEYLLYRTYHGCAMPEQVQLASVSTWNDEQHVIANRALYKEKFEHVLNILDGSLDVSMPEASFYLWPKTPIDDTQFAQRLFAEQNITALPGQFLSRKQDGINPGEKHIRIALVATLEECIDAAQRLKAFSQSLR